MKLNNLKSSDLVIYFLENRSEQLSIVKEIELSTGLALNHKRAGVPLGSRHQLEVSPKQVKILRFEKKKKKAQPIFQLVKRILKKKKKKKKG